MSCRHDLANGTCIRCYPDNPYGRSDRDRVDPGPEEDYEPNLEGPGAIPADDDEDYFHGPCAHVFQGVDDHDECMHCGALRYYSLGKPLLVGVGPIGGTRP